MTGKRVRKCIADDKSAVDVRRKTLRMLEYRQICVSSGLSGRCIGPVGDQGYRMKSLAGVLEYKKQGF